MSAPRRFKADKRRRDWRTITSTGNRYRARLQAEIRPLLELLPPVRTAREVARAVGMTPQGVIIAQNRALLKIIAAFRAIGREAFRA